MARSPATGSPGWWRDGRRTSKTVADLRRRRLQTVVLAVVLLLGSAAATLALSILVETNEPFDNAFAAANGAHLVIDYDAAVSDAQLGGDDGRRRCHVQRRSMARHARRRGGKARPDRGPGRVRAADAGRHGRPGHDHGRTLVAGAGRDRPRPGHGRPARHRDRWIGAAVSQPASGGKGAPGRGAWKGPAPRAARQGARAAPTPVPARTLTVVGIAASVSTPDVAAWMSPTDLAALDPRTSHPLSEMLYRVDPSGTAADLSAAVARITATPPAERRGLDDLSRDKGERRHRSPSCTSRSCSRSRSSRFSPRLHHRQRRQRHRPDELSRHRRHEGRRIHARAGDGHPRRARSWSR